jgi:hypothetical protein
METACFSETTVRHDSHQATPCHKLETITQKFTLCRTQNLINVLLLVLHKKLLAGRQCEIPISREHQNQERDARLSLASHVHPLAAEENPEVQWFMCFCLLLSCFIGRGQLPVINKLQLQHFALQQLPHPFISQNTNCYFGIIPDDQNPNNLKYQSTFCVIFQDNTGANDHRQDEEMWSSL